MIRAHLVDPADKTAIGVEKFWDTESRINTDERALVASDPFKKHGTFSTLAYSGAGTTQFVLPAANGSLILTDLIFTADKVNNGSVEILFTDGTDTATIVKPVVTDAPVSLSVAFGGRWQGWRDARIDIIVTNAVSGTVALGYVKNTIGLTYAEWDELR